MPETDSLANLELTIRVYGLTNGAFNDHFKKLHCIGVVVSEINALRNKKVGRKNDKD